MITANHQLKSGWVEKNTQCVASPALCVEPREGGRHGNGRIHPVILVPMTKSRWEYQLSVCVTPQVYRVYKTDYHNGVRYMEKGLDTVTPPCLPKAPSGGRGYCILCKGNGF